MPSIGFHGFHGFHDFQGFQGWFPWIPWIPWNPWDPWNSMESMDSTIPWGPWGNSRIPWGERWGLGIDGALGPMGFGPQGRGGLSNPFPSFYFRRTSAIYLAQDRIGNPLGFPRSHRILLDGRPAAGQLVSGQPANHPSTNAHELEIRRKT